jgi:hypothetical protein
VAALNEDHLPAVFSLVRKLLVARGPMTRRELIDALTPAGLISRSADASRSRHVEPSVNLLASLDVLVDRDGVVDIAERARTESGLRVLVAEALTLPPEDGDVWAMRSEQSYEHEVALALAWLMLQPVGEPLADWASVGEVLLSQLGRDRNLLRDSARYQTLVRLAVWIGAAARVALPREGLVPDPTDALRPVVAALLAARQEQPLSALRRDLSAAISWSPEGLYGLAMRERFPALESVAAGALWESLSLGLLGLEQDGTLVLIEGDDTVERTTLSLSGRGTRAVARARWREEAA